MEYTPFPYHSPPTVTHSVRRLRTKREEGEEESQSPVAKGTGSIIGARCSMVRAHSSMRGGEWQQVKTIVHQLEYRLRPGDDSQLG